VSDLALLELLHEALRSPFGIVVETPDAEFLRQKLYPVRKTSPEFNPLAFVISPLGNGDLWILRKPDNAE
jgi:hypothetical protein